MNPDPGTSPARPHAHTPRGSVAQPGAGEIIFEGTMQHSASAGSYLWWFLVSVAGGVAAWALNKIEFFQEFPMWLLSFAGLPGIFWTFLRHVTTRYKISARRVESERGVLAKSVESLELWRVLDVRYRQTIIDRMLGNARITLIGTDKSDPELVLYGLPDHRQLFERLRDAVQAARHTSRPMEVVGDAGVLEELS